VGAPQATRREDLLNKSVRKVRMGLVSSMSSKRPDYIRSVSRFYRSLLAAVPLCVSKVVPSIDKRRRLSRISMKVLLVLWFDQKGELACSCSKRVHTWRAKAFQTFPPLVPPKTLR
jgi:hypothetical protein